MEYPRGNPVGSGGKEDRMAKTSQVNRNKMRERMAARVAATKTFYAQLSADQQKAHRKVVQMVLPAKFSEKLKARSAAPTG